jgi:competence protein ComEC
VILGVLAFAWLLGVAAAAFTGADPWAALAAAAGLGALSFALRPRASTLALIALGAALIFAASWRYESTVPPAAPSGIAQQNDSDPVRFRALIVSEPDDRGGTVRYRLAVRDVYWGDRWRPESGGILMRTAPFPRYEYGDLLDLEGELETPPTFDDFDYREYLLRRGIGSLIAYPSVRVVARDQGSAFRAALIDTRARLSDALADALPEPEASLATGVLLGKRARLPADLAEDMNATGTSHLVAVSGQNVTLVAGLLIAALAWAVGRRPAAWLALAAVIGYSFLVGGEPSVVRAAIMGSLYVVATALGRQSSAPIALALAGAVMTAIDPQVVHDVSFQLSFAATLGLMSLAPLLAARARAFTQRWPSADEFFLTRPTIEMAAVTLAAIAFTLPITAVNFQRVSLVAPLANLLAVPAFLAVAVTATVTASIGAVLPAASGALGWLAWPPAAYMVAVVRLAADVPLASTEVRGLGTEHAIVYYGALAVVVWLLGRRRPEPLVVSVPERPSPSRTLIPVPGMLLLLALASALLWLSITTPVSGRLTVTFLDVGQGDAILIEGPDGHRILVDGGPSENAITSALGRCLPFYDRHIDLVVLTHPEADHLGGLPAVLNRYDVGAALVSPVQADSAVYRAWRDSLRARSTPYHEAVAGQTIDLGNGARLYVLSAPPPQNDPNEGSVVIKLTMGRASFLLTGDIESTREAVLVRSGVDLRAAVYKVPHHGSDTSSSSAFLAAVDPLLDVISVGLDNRYGHPTPDVLDRLDGDAIFRTDLNGDVAISTDGRRLWIETAR